MKNNSIIIIIALIAISMLGISSVSAVQFSSPSGTTGGIGNGNGYFDNDATQFNLNQLQNIYAIAEPLHINIIEPIGYALGKSGAPVLVNKGATNLRYATVASDGFLYFVDGAGVKKKSTRSLTTPAGADDTGVGGATLLIYASAGVFKLFEYNHNIYFIDGTSLKYFPLDGIYSVSTLYAGMPTQGGAGFVIEKLGTDITVVYYQNPGGAYNYITFNSSGSHSYYNAEVGGSTTFFITPNYIYSFGGNVALEKTRWNTNFTTIHTNFYVVPPNQENTANIGPFTTVAMYASSATQYNVFNFIEPSFSGGTNLNSQVSGNFVWSNPYGASVTSINAGDALEYKFNIFPYDSKNFTFYSGWAFSGAATPQQLSDFTNLTGQGTPAFFNTPSATLQGTTIYGYIIAQNNTDKTWSLLTLPVQLRVNPIAAGYDSMLLDKTSYVLNNDTITATFSYQNGFPWIYELAICTRSDCSDRDTFQNTILVNNPTTQQINDNGYLQGNYYAVMMKHLPFLQNTIVATQPFTIHPPFVGVSWDKTTYNLLPRTITTSTCQDSTPSVSHFNTVLGYGGLQAGFFSCSAIPAQSSANNSVMRGTLYAKFNATFFLNNSLGNVWNGTLNNGSATIIYVLTNSSPLEQWTLIGVNQSNDTYVATANVNPESIFAYHIAMTPNPAYNLDTLYLTFSRPIDNFNDYVVLTDASGQTLTTFKGTSGTYYIDPTKSYAYGTWSAYWHDGANACNTSGLGGLGQGSCIGTLVTTKVINAARAHTNASTIPVDQNQQNQATIDIGNLLSSNIVWAFLIVAGTMAAVAIETSRNHSDPMLPSVIVGFLGISAFTVTGWIPSWITFSIVLIVIVTLAWQRTHNQNTGGQ